MTQCIRTAALILLAASLAIPALAEDAATLYKAKCAMCHGADGLATSTMAKNLKVLSFKTPEMVNASDARFIASTANGKGARARHGHQPGSQGHTPDRARKDAFRSDPRRARPQDGPSDEHHRPVRRDRRTGPLVRQPTSCCQKDIAPDARPGLDPGLDGAEGKDAEDKSCGPLASSSDRAFGHLLVGLGRGLRHGNAGLLRFLLLDIHSLFLLGDDPLGLGLHQVFGQLDLADQHRDQFNMVFLKLPACPVFGFLLLFMTVLHKVHGRSG